MKNINQGIVTTLAVLFITAAQTFAIEGLKLQIHCPDVVLSWPSADGETYIVQHRETLSTNTPWVTLTNALPADTTTNITTFVHSNRVDCPTGQIFGMMMSSGGNSGLGSERMQTDFTPTGPVVMPKNGSKTPVPLEIYPPGFDLSGYIIIWPDGSTEEWSEKAVAAYKAIQREEQDDPQTEDASGGGSEPGTGFYQVVRDGVSIVNSSLTNLTNGVLSGSLVVGIEAGNADPNGLDVKGQLSCATLLIDGETYPSDGVLGPPPAYFWHFTMDTAFLENGDHYLQIQVSWKNPDSTDNNHQYLSRWSDPVFVTVSNEVNYPQWASEVGEADIAAFFLQTVHTNAAWQIQITDVNSNIIQTLSGYATNGLIEAYWNLMDTNGVLRTNTTVDPMFNSATSVQSNGQTTTKKNPPKHSQPKNWPDHGRWVMTYQDYFKFEYSANNAQLYSEYAFANTAAKYGGYTLYYPQPGQTNDIGQTYPLRYQKTNHLDTNITFDAMYKDKQLLWTFLQRTNSRNLYYDGHGDPDTIADTSSVIIKGLVQDHRYRFVFLNSCSSANGDLAKAFGITESKRNDIGYYQKTGIRPAAFMGYTTDVFYSVPGVVIHGGVPYDDTIPFQVPGFITNFIFFWDTDTYGLGLLSSISNAKAGLPPINTQYREDYLIVRGYFDLRIDEYNHRSDSW